MEKGKGLNVALATTIAAMSISGCKANTNEIHEESLNTPIGEYEGVRIPGEGRQEELHSVAIVFVHDNEEPNENGWYDRTVVQADIDDLFAGLEIHNLYIPATWDVERDYSLKNESFVPYITLTPPVEATLQEITNVLGNSNEYSVTSVVIREDGQECSMPGIVPGSVRTNIYLGSDWSYQSCNQ